MEGIACDARHDAVTTVDARQQTGRRFGDWQMAYCGTAVFVQQHVDAMLPVEAAAARPDRIERLRRLMRELAAGGVSQR
jgi:hypothetical protein